ncbi:MAG: uracil-DNA glycosylase [Oligoflexia bacterium]|nr:uracil-DNA glycosylase [Oligoflexia bacterium]MBF0364969.1 uracil-DNA glycosylase [Oligoflexia bacterium]
MATSEVKKQINCFHCQHYYLTWDANAPNGCKFFSFKSKESPAKLVAISSGHECTGFTPKRQRPKIREDSPKATS